MTKPLYLANPYGFSPSLRDGPLAHLMFALTELDAAVVEPFEHVHKLGLTDPLQPYEIGQANLTAIDHCKALFAVLNGEPPDGGVAVELGYAVAKGYPTFLFRDDFRRCADTDMYPMNLMFFRGLSKNYWEKSYYTSVDQLKDPEKRLAQWLKEPVAV